MLSRILTTTILVSLLTSTSVTAEDYTAEQIKELVLEAILENPEIVMQAVNILQERDNAAAKADAAESLASQRNILENDPNAPVLGNPEGDVTVVEFFDYNCPYCKKAGEIVKELIDQDPNVRVVYREWPILSEGSVVASRAALASRLQGKYEEFHWALMEQQGRLEEAKVFSIAEDIGLDIDQLAKDMNSAEVDDHLETTQALATTLGFGGTPSFVVGDELVPGMVQLPALQKLVEAKRTN